MLLQPICCSREYVLQPPNQLLHPGSRSIHARICWKGVLTQLDHVSNHAHDQETHPHGLTYAQEFSAVGWLSHNTYQHLDRKSNGRREGGIWHTFRTSCDELPAVLHEVARHFEEFFCLVHGRRKVLCLILGWMRVECGCRGCCAELFFACVKSSSVARWLWFIGVKLMWRRWK